MNETIIKRAVELNDPSLANAALKEIDAQLSSSPDANQRLYLLLSSASCYGILGNFDEARRQLDIAMQERPNADTQLTIDYIQGVLSQREGSCSQALERLSATLSVHSTQFERPEMRFMYEDIQGRRGFLMTSLRMFNEAIPILPEFLSFDLDEQVRSDALASLGLCYLELHDYYLAKDKFLKATAIGLTTQWQGEAHFYLGIAYFHTDMFQEAKKEFQVCEELAARHLLPTTDMYKWLSAAAKRLGEFTESDRYAKLARSN